jgi:hypothetical protein
LEGTQICFCQSIEVKIYLLDSCKNSVKKLELFELKKNAQTFIFNSDIDSSLILKDTGIYYLQSQYVAGKVELKIFNYGQYTDTLVQSNVIEIFTIHQKPSKRDWLCCDKKCNGFQIGYYQNGNKRVEGNFKEGKPIGELKFYKENGGLSYIENYNKRGKFINRKDYK